MSTWEKVNAAFGQIFSGPLPGGSFASLTPRRQDHQRGLSEVKVCLGNRLEAKLNRAEWPGQKRYVI